MTQIFNGKNVLYICKPEARRYCVDFIKDTVLASNLATNITLLHNSLTVDFESEGVEVVVASSAADVPKGAFDYFLTIDYSVDEETKQEVLERRNQCRTTERLTK